MCVAKVEGSEYVALRTVWYLRYGTLAFFGWVLGVCEPAFRLNVGTPELLYLMKHDMLASAGMQQLIWYTVCMYCYIQYITFLHPEALLACAQLPPLQFFLFFFCTTVL